MNDKNPNPHRKHSALSRQHLLQYVLTLLAFTALYFFLVSFFWQFFSQFTWQETNPVYRFLQWVKSYLILWTMIILGGGWLVITYIYLCKPLRYLDELAAAAEQLAHPDEIPIHLPSGIKHIEDKLNLAREQALRHMLIARETEQRKNDLIVYLAHDLKTPLTSIIGYLSLLRDEPYISAQLRERYTGIALEKAERLEDLINEFFEITRFNLTHLTLETEPVDLTRMLQQISNEFEPVFAEKELTYTLDLPTKLPYECDADKLARVFDNLFRNACHYSFPGSHISVSGKQDATMITLTFMNPGKTIPPDKLSRIFEQFFRLDSARGTNSGGAGLGLAIAKEIITLHGGTITAASAENQVVFTIMLPLPGKPSA